MYLGVGDLCGLNVGKAVSVAIGISLIAIILGSASLMVAMDARSGLMSEIGRLSARIRELETGTELSRRIEAAQKEGKLVLYMVITGVEPLVAEFERRYGIKTEAVRVSTAAFLTTVLTESQAGKLEADILQGPVDLMRIVKAENVLEKYVSSESSSYPDWAKDPDGFLQPFFSIETVSIMYNTKLVKAEEAPRRYEDLIDPKWRGKIVMADPSIHATTISWLVSLKEQVFKDEAKWTDFLKGLLAQKPTFVQSFRPVIDPVIRGEAALGITATKYVITLAPAPIDWARIEQPTFGEPRALGITNKALHPNAARLFVDFLLSRLGAEILAKSVGEYSLCRGVYSYIKEMDRATVVPARSLSDTELKQWSETFRKIFF